MEKGRDTWHDTLRDVEVNSLVKTLSERLAVVKAKTVSDVLGHIEGDSLVNQFSTMQAKMEAKTIGGRLLDV